MTKPMMNVELVGEVLGGRYRVLEPLERGGMGAVMVALDQNLNRRVAVKVIHPELASETAFTERLRREAMVVGGLAHPHIVQTTDFGVGPQGEPFIVMELLEGEPLSRLLKREGRLATPRVAFIADQILDALGAAHAAGVVHRDLKPANVFLTRLASVQDVVKLLDFGGALLQESEAWRRLTRTGQIVGTPAWMAPEYARGETVDGRADVYGVGLIMYLAVAGTLPFRVKHAAEYIRAIQEQDPPSLQPYGVDAAFEAIVREALAKDPNRRFPTAAEMRTALDPWLALRDSGVPALPRQRDDSAQPTTQARPSTARRRVETPLALDRPSWAAQAPLAPRVSPATKPSPRSKSSSGPGLVVVAALLAVAVLVGAAVAVWGALDAEVATTAPQPTVVPPPRATVAPAPEEVAEPVPLGIDPPPDDPEVAPPPPRRTNRRTPAAMATQQSEAVTPPSMRSHISSGGTELVDPFAD